MNLRFSFFFQFCFCRGICRLLKAIMDSPVTDFGIPMVWRQEAEAGAGAGAGEPETRDRSAGVRFERDRIGNVNVMLRVHVQTHARTPVLHSRALPFRGARGALSECTMRSFPASELRRRRRFHCFVCAAALFIIGAGSSMLRRLHWCLAFAFVFGFSIPSCSLPTSTCSRLSLSRPVDRKCLLFKISLVSYQLPPTTFSSAISLRLFYSF